MNDRRVDAQTEEVRSDRNAAHSESVRRYLGHGVEAVRLRLAFGCGAEWAFGLTSPPRVDQAAAAAAVRYGVQEKEREKFEAFIAGAMWAAEHHEDSATAAQPEPQANTTDAYIAGHASGFRTAVAMRDGGLLAEPGIKQDDGLTQAAITTRHPEHYLLVNEADGTSWRLATDGSWVSAAAYPTDEDSR